MLDVSINVSLKPRPFLTVDSLTPVVNSVFIWVYKEKELIN